MSNLWTSLNKWYVKNQRDLPWRKTDNPYFIWISEVMLQQTQVKKVLDYYIKFTEKFKTLESLSQANLDEVYAAWAGLGYYRRAALLKKGAEFVEKNGWPKNKDEWEKVPGVGPYTAGAIASIAYNLPESILDGNVERVLGRVFSWKKPKNLSDKKKFWDQSKTWVLNAYQKKIEPRVWNQALMELGACICKPLNPSCELCPIQENCKSFQENTVHLYPGKTIKKWVDVSEKKILCIKSHKILLEKQIQKKWRQGLWDLPDADEKIKFLRKFQIHYRVTNHKVEREILQTQDEPRKLNENFKFISYQDIIQKKIPIPSPLLRFFLNEILNIR